MRFCFAAFFLTIVTFGHSQPVPVAGAEMLEAAKRDARNGKYTQAFASLDQFEKAKRPTWQSLDLRGCIYLEQGKIDEAAKTFGAARADDSSVFAPRIHGVDVLLRERKYDEARKAYNGLIAATNSFMANERLRYGILICCLALRDETEAKSAFARIAFPTETPAFYYAQAAWDFSHGKESDAKKWLTTAERIFPTDAVAWFARPLYDLGWVKKKPPVALD